MAKVCGTISQKGVSGSITQKGVRGNIVQKGVAGTIVESGVSGSMYCDEAMALFNRLTGEQPSVALKELINEVIVYAKEDGWFQLGDCWYMKGVHTAELACQNWIKNAHNSTLVNSPTFTEKVGFSGGVGKYINNNYNLYTEADKFTLSESSIMFMSTLVGADYTSPLGVYAIPNRTYIITFPAADRCYMNTDVSNNFLTFESGGYYGYVGNGIPLLAYRDGAYVASVNRILNEVLSDLSMWELQLNYGTTPMYNWGATGNICFSWYGGYMTTPQMLALYTRIKYFYDNVGGTF